jgi:hypothetical protein
MSIQLDKSALEEAQEAYWNASEAGTDKGVEAAIAAYLARVEYRTPTSFFEKMTALALEQRP